MDDREILGDWVDEGYWLREYEDHIVTVGYKDREIAAFSQIGATPKALQDACSRHQRRLRAPVEVAS